MALDTDDEILQDFLVEAEEILDGLNEQLVALETQPQDKDLLNSIFRGFHTIKGGAGFLSLEAMVNLCHKGEDVFNLLRQGERLVDADMMDTFLKVLDILNSMFAEVKAGSYPTEADPVIIQQLAAYLSGDAPPVVAEPEPEPEPEITVPAADNVASDEITDDEFEALLDQLHGNAPPGITPPADPPKTDPVNTSGDDEISEEEFEALLDELQGKKPAAKPTPPAKPAAEAASPPPSPPKPETTPKAVDDGDSVTAVKPAAAAPQAKAAADTSVRVDTARLDDIMNMVGELVLVRNRINTLEAAFENEEMAKAVNNLAVVTGDLQTAVMKTRMQPIKKVFGRFPRVVRDLARSLKKDINLELRGEETDLDKNLVEALADPLVHLVRNAVDHGVEMPDIREASGKPKQGQIVLAAAQEGDHILLTISDDGAGMNPEILRRKAVEKGMMDEEAASRLTESECFALIFAPGFSMKQEISDISGRGVGMDVVKTSISKLNGVIDIQSEIGKGTTLSIKVPLTLAIMPTLMVMLGNQIFAFPLVSVNEIFNLDLNKTNTVDGQQTVIVRNKALPLFYLRKWLNKGNVSESKATTEHVVIVNVGTRKVGFVVDQLIGQEEVVIKPLGALLHGTKGFAGATITGDGRIALILDFPELMNTYAHRNY
ncbi:MULTISPECIES: chemotaxis protein CheA [unclassified Methylophaga]|uniref:chemotaxis protein CheA n=1 Tax=unclassified Methylophaga TaxID=2629249 RepID=UPI000C93E2A8|nr:MULTISPECIES: chemotaxis protein CheA [unclassified Methylophaga]MBN46006.1 chemotaxis protein CheA [Methylophaga sp.]|tara:strand:- start:44940 stop:46916 length:1977 start_codon:yes stop_codon:yes gene_type:complete